MATDKTKHLSDVLDSHRMVHIESLFNKYKSKRDDVKSSLDSNYNNNSYACMNSGSYAKHTAINIKFDLDIVLPFNKKSFTSLEEMFDSVYNFLSDKYKDEAFVRKQKVSIGIEFFGDDDGDVISIDVVPGRELNEDQYVSDKKLNLYINSTYGELAAKSYLQTNIHSQIEHIKNRNDERKIIRLLKGWKVNNNEAFKSFFLELITIKAFDTITISGSLWERLKSVLEYIRDNVNKEGFTLIDPGNTGNDIAKTLEEFEKHQLKSKMDSMLQRIEDNSDNIKLYFPINEDFHNDDEENKYKSKGGGGSFFSVPPKEERFG